MMGMTDAIGFLAGVLTTIAFVPQALKMYASKSGKDVSARMLLIFSAGVILWLIYGIMIGSLPVILANLVTLILSATIIALKIRYGRRNSHVSRGPGLP
jgi:MtN3 and saliva related transmembrane protein